ncbi:MAG: hypothetical protein EBU82_12630 [Flavobacteriia bacterium]|jgi:hypothetical protein|nr:hypothetical protein [Flavobacteriia bacterium]
MNVREWYVAEVVRQGGYAHIGMTDAELDVAYHAVFPVNEYELELMNHNCDDPANDDWMNFDDEE